MFRDAVQLTASGEQFEWLPAAGLNTNIKDTVLAFPAGTTTYTVKGTNASGCHTSKSIDVTVRPTPVADAGLPANICSGDTVRIGMTAQAGIVYSWTPASGILDPGVADPLVAPLYNGTSADTSYTYYLTAALGSFCSSTDSTVITVRKSPNLSILAAAHVICKGNTTEIAAYGAEKYTWLPVQGLDDPNTGVVYATPAATTTYTVTGSLTNGCARTAGVTITVNDHAKALFSATDTLLCAPAKLETLIKATAFPQNNSGYYWYINGVLTGNNNTAQFPAYEAVTPADTLQVKLVAVSAAGCNNDSMQLQLITRPAVLPVFTKDKDSACGPLQVNFQNTYCPYPGTQYEAGLWERRYQYACTARSGYLFISPEYVDTVYYIHLSADNGCGNVVFKDSIKVFANSQPVLSPVRRKDVSL